MSPISHNLTDMFPIFCSSYVLCVSQRMINYNQRTAVLATIHSIVCYVSRPSVSLHQFLGSRQALHLQLLAHMYGVKNRYTSLIRAYAACYVDTQPLYDLATFTYAFVLFLFITEFLVCKTARLQEAVFLFVNAGIGLTWMMGPRGWYVAH
jgi:hypothetical protein